MTLIIALDTETTGFGQYDRIVEIGCVIFDTESASIVGEFETLLNPEMKIPNKVSEIHGLNNEHVSIAPVFSEVASGLKSLLESNLIVAHNADFDVRMLQQEFNRLGMDFNPEQVFCTYQATGLSLPFACEQIDFPLTHHSALSDAKACMALLLASEYEVDFRDLEPEEAVLPLAFRTVTRSQLGLTPTERRQTRFSKFRIEFDAAGAEGTYLGILDTYLRDQHLNSDELTSLRGFAEASSISADRQQELHNIYLDKIQQAALRDGKITQTEREFFSKIASGLGIERNLPDFSDDNFPVRPPSEILSAMTQGNPRWASLTTEDFADLKASLAKEGLVVGSDHPFSGKNFVITLFLESMTEPVFWLCVAMAGGEKKANVSKVLDVLVEGTDPTGKYVKGQTTKSVKARELNASGNTEIAILDEVKFLELLGPEILRTAQSLL